MFYYVYFFIGVLFYIIALPFLFILSFKNKYKFSIPARFFLYKNSPLASNGIHFHICSFGEARAIEPIIKNLPIDKLRFSTITQTGFDVIKTYNLFSRYLPFEIFLPFWLKKQKALVVMEAELWYMLFATYKKKGVKSFLINARISKKSYPKYLRFKWFYKKIFKNIDFVFAQSKLDAARLKSLGAKNIEVIGNIKFATNINVKKNLLKNYDIVITAGSTHKNEEELILKAFLAFKKKYLNSQLIVVPRHPERFEKVASLLNKEANKNKLSFARYSVNNSLKEDIILVDKLGELIEFYAISDIVILGGAFEKIGGHNAIEPAYFNCKIISGENYFNQKDIFSAVKNIKIVKKEQLKDALLNYKNIKNSKIKKNTNINTLVKKLQHLLDEGKN